MDKCLRTILQRSVKIRTKYRKCKHKLNNYREL